MKYHENEYLELKTLLADMSQQVSDMIEKSIKALVTHNTMLAKEVIEKDDEIDHLDIQIDELCMKILALYEPKAIDLRNILTISRIIVDLERIGDYCVNISKEVLRINGVPQIKPYVDLPLMAKSAKAMLKDAVDAYFNENSILAIEVIKRDDVIDELHGKIIQELFDCVLSDSDKTRGAILLMFITRSIERIADHATNIAELVYFMVTGKIIRHTKIESEDK